jgi:hypothetical protein
LVSSFYSCKLPDASARHSFQCACGDTPYAIIAARASEDWQNNAFWCSTVMSMLDYDGTQMYVFNPYSLATLRAMVGAPSRGMPLDQYLACVADDQSNCEPPSDAVFETQQISMVAVYQRCLANYQSLQWDLSTHVLFDPVLKAKLHTTVVVPTPPCTTVPGFACLGDCLIAARNQGTTSNACLDLLLTKLSTTSLDYFEYADATGATVSHTIDACQVFSGPAQQMDGESFRACLDHYLDSGACKLPLLVWSGRSSNRLPVAMDHATCIADASAKETAARRVYREVRDQVKIALEALRNTWSADSLSISVFSAEGDMLHQYFDCVMLGAMGRVDFWPGPLDLERPVWSRRSDNADNREFELPCSGAQLNDRSGTRDDQTPFTCGSNARRAVIKYFIRNKAGSNAESNRQAITTAVQQLITDLTKAFVTDDQFLNYLCQYEDGTHSFACCSMDCVLTTPCPCPNDAAPSFACCDCVATSLLPIELQVFVTEWDSLETPGKALTKSMRLKVSVSFASGLRPASFPGSAALAYQRASPRPGGAAFAFR